MLVEREGMYWPTAEITENAHADKATYEAMYRASIDDPDAFWGEHGKRIDWIKPYTKVKNTSFAPGNVSIKWYEDGTLNVSANCVDRHLATRGDKTAIIWEPDDPEAPSRFITYKELHTEVSKFANVLKKMGVSKGDRVVLYMPIPRSRLCHACLGPDRRDPLDRLCRLFARCVGGAGRWLGSKSPDHRR